MMLKWHNPPLRSLRNLRALCGFAFRARRGTPKSSGAVFHSLAYALPVGGSYGAFSLIYWHFYKQEVPPPRKIQQKDVC
jgi:hypothetical protein